MRGVGFVRDPWKFLRPDLGYKIALDGELRHNGKRCELIAFAQAGTFAIDRHGRLRGHFVVPPRGRCFQEDGGGPVMPGRYFLILSCHTCVVASFRVTER
jgi:hypothetical protein